MRAPLTYQRCRKILRLAGECARKTRAYSYLASCIRAGDAIRNSEWAGGGYFTGRDPGLTMGRSLLHKGHSDRSQVGKSASRSAT